MSKVASEQYQVTVYLQSSYLSASLEKIFEVPISEELSAVSRQITAVLTFCFYLK